jgi:hypothetical protein
VIGRVERDTASASSAATLITTPTPGASVAEGVRHEQAAQLQRAEALAAIRRTARAWPRR